MRGGFVPNSVSGDLGIALHQTKRKDEEGGHVGVTAERFVRGRAARAPLERAARVLDLVQMGDAKARLVLHVADIAG
ncbi:hypothetical protein F7R13_03540 [Burkholderia territorii]|uniref:Uncharacterized protein n=1 Tax=Burkholderia territorii TaxID=1503055 RepID=A0A6L3NM14_9BURK|nr:hypothetical protein F7R13_03540 [Burkholderia territorii]